ncbi:Uncharacterised protein r2_g2934 [Pycnogonum litorale]
MADNLSVPGNFSIEKLLGRNWNSQKSECSAIAAAAAAAAAAANNCATDESSSTGIGPSTGKISAFRHFDSKSNEVPVNTYTGFGQNLPTMPSVNARNPGAVESPILHMDLFHMAQNFARSKLEGTSWPMEYHRRPVPSTDGENRYGSSSSIVYPGKPLKCICCSFVTSSMHSLMDHIDIHFPVKSFVCIHCLQNLRSEIELNRHLQIEHVDFNRS